MAIIENVGDNDLNLSGFILEKGKEMPLDDNKLISLIMMNRTFHEAVKKELIKIDSANPKVIFIIEDVVRNGR